MASQWIDLLHAVKSLKTCCNLYGIMAMLANECCCGQRLNSKPTCRITLQHSSGKMTLSCLHSWHFGGSKGKVRDLLKCKRVILWAI